MSDRDPQIDNIQDPKLKELALLSRKEFTVDFGMNQHGGVDLEKFAQLVRQELRREMGIDGAAPAPKTRKP